MNRGDKMILKVLINIYYDLRYIFRMGEAVESNNFQSLRKR